MTRFSSLCSLLMLTAAGSAVAQTPSPTPAPTSETDGQTKTSIGLRMDCVNDFNLDKGAPQECLGLSGARLGIEHQVSPEVRARLRLDPFSTPLSAREDSPLRSQLPTSADTALGIIDDYGVIWTPRPALEVGVQAYNGAANLPSVSGLSLANSFNNTGWRTTAVTLGYTLSVPTEMHVQFAAGNGEGEPVHNQSPQQYFGFTLEALLVHSLHLNIGLSLNGNDVGGEEYLWMQKHYQTQCTTAPQSFTNRLGHSTQRNAAALVLDGTWAGAEGLKASLGWQRLVETDLDKHGQAYMSADQLEAGGCPIDLDSFFVEDPTDNTANTVTITTLDASVNYQITPRYFVAADYTSRRVDSGVVQLFQTCSAYTGSSCTAPNGDKTNRLSQSAITVGGGMNLGKDLLLTLEYSEADYDKAYSQLFYEGQNGKATRTLEVFNARLAYNWK